MRNRTILIVTSLLSLRPIHGGHGGGGRGPYTMHVCNRGLCYNKKEESLYRSLQQQKQQQKVQEGGGGADDFCDGRRQCELYSILAAETIYEQLEAVECNSLNCPDSEQQQQQQQRDTPTAEEASNDTNAHNCDVDDIIDLDQRRSWKDEPKKGNCYDDNLGYLFDCYLLKVLDDGQVLIEDLQSGGAFATQSSTFHLHTKDEKRKYKTNVPNVVIAGEDPTIDFRTIVELNMMGI